MDADRWPLVKACFSDALEAAPAARADLLAGLDEATRAEVEAMLVAAEATDGVLDVPLATALLPTGVERVVQTLPTSGASGAEGPLSGEALGPYRLGPCIGRGGMGDVYRAHRADGLFERAVALKLVRDGADTEAVLARFAAERRILGSLEHPGIARLIAAGAEAGGPAAGRPWLALELVEGVPLTEATPRLDARTRIALLADVAEAVHHAHRRLVVHRDLKPSNVLVSTDEAGAPVAKLLDFGIAKLLDPSLDPALTAIHARTPMTRAYAAPEQVSSGAITTATDVYGLGLLLFEALTGRRPFEVGDDVRELERQILDDEPPAPSAVTSAGGLEARVLRGDLDVICRTALAKAPEARYASAEALAADLRRWLAAEPIEARAPSAAYRARRFAERHRLGVAAVALVLLAVGAGVASTLWQAREARVEAQRSAATSAFLVSLFGDTDPSAVQGDTLSALDLLDRGARRIEVELGAQPATQADLYGVIAQAFGALGRRDRAETFARRALALRRPGGAAADPRAAVYAQVALGDVIGEAAGDTLLADAVRHARAFRDPEPLLHALYHVALNTDARRVSPGRGAPLLDEAVAAHRRHHGDQDAHLGVISARLATASADIGDYRRAESLLRAALATLPAPTYARERIPVLLDLANILTFTGREHEAVGLGRQALALARTLYGDDHAVTAEAHEALSGALPAAQDASALVHAAEAIRILDALGEPAAPVGRRASAYAHLFNTLRQGGRSHAAATAAARQAAELSERLDADDPRRATHANIYAIALTAEGRHADAEPQWARALQLHERLHGPTSPVTLLHRLRNARAARKADEALSQASSWNGTGQSAAGRRAERLYATADSLALRHLPATSHTRAEIAYERGRFLLGARRPEAAADPLRRAVAARSVLGRTGVDSHPMATSLGNLAEATLGRALWQLGRTEAAERHLARAASALAASLGAEHPEALLARDALRAVRAPLARQPVAPR